MTQTDSSGTLTYTWDARHRLIALTSPTLTASFAYDGLGRRAQKTINSVLTQFRYDGVDAVQESSGGNAATYLRALGIDEALVRTEATDTAHYLGDALGGSVALTTAGGAPATTYTYAPFGETAVAGTPNPNAFRFTGREDDGTGLYYYRARYYDPTRSRFVSADPAGNPVNATDPLGLAHEGFIKQLSEMADRSVRSAIKNLGKRIEEHVRSLNDPVQQLAKQHHDHELRVLREQLSLARQEALRRSLKIGSGIIAIILSELLMPDEANAGEEEMLRRWQCEQLGGRKSGEQCQACP